MKKVRILAMSKFSRRGGNTAQIAMGFFYAYKNIAVLYPCSIVVMAIVSPFVDLDNRKGGTAFFMPPQQNLLIMSKNTNNLAEAWARLIVSHGEQTPKQIKRSLFIIQNHLLIHPSSEAETSMELKDAMHDMHQLYDFLDEMELNTNLIN